MKVWRVKANKLKMKVRVTVTVRVRRRELGAGDAQEKQEPHTKDVGNYDQIGIVHAARPGLAWPG